MLPVYYINDALSNATKVNDIEFDLHARKKTTFLYFVAAGGHIILQIQGPVKNISQ